MKGELTLKQLRKAYKSAVKLAEPKCNVCGKKAKFAYYWKDNNVGYSCKNHEIVKHESNTK